MDEDRPLLKQEGWDDIFWTSILIAASA